MASPTHSSPQQMPPLQDAAEALRALERLRGHGDVFEVRALEATMDRLRQPMTISGYFDNAEAAVHAIGAITSAKGIYVTLNRIDRALLSRAANRLRVCGRGDSTTSDTDVTGRDWLLVDIDPKRPAGISATDTEHNAALELAKVIRAALAQEGWPTPILADSGNGAHLLYRIGLPADDGALVQSCLKAIAFRFGTHDLDIDLSVFNPARIVKLYGTVAGKGDNTPERPHRVARMLDAPEVCDVVPIERLRGLADSVPLESPVAAGMSRGRHMVNGEVFDVDAWLRKYCPEAQEPTSWSGGRKWVFPQCPWNPAHTNHSAYVVQMANGAIAAGCHHNGCAGKGWHDLRELREPGWHRGQGGDTASRGVVPPSLPTPSEPWPDPLPLPGGLPPVAPFTYDLLPGSLHSWIRDIAERMQCPPDYCAVGVMVMACSIVGRRVGIRPKAQDDWTVIPNLYGAIVGRPSMLKSPALQEVLKYLQQREVKAKQQYDETLRQQEADELVADAKKKLLKEQLKEKIRNGEDAADLAAELAGGGCTDPVRRRFLVNDTTVEKLGEILKDNANGILIFQDELVSFFRTLDREGHEADRGFYLTAWNGNSRYTYDRIGRGTVDIEAAIVSILGGIQPSVLADYLRDAVNGGRGDDGLMPRFQMIVWPDSAPAWRNIDRRPDTAARDRAYAALDRLAALDLDRMCAMRDPDGHDAVRYLRFSEGAQAIFDLWRTDLENRIRRPEEHPFIEAHLAKYRKLVPALALVLHLLDDGIGPVSAEAAAKAIRWAEYLESHARRLYASISQAPAVAAVQLAKRIQSGMLDDLFTARDVYRMGWTGLDRQQTEAAIDVLTSLNWLDDRVEATAGRTKTRYAINPKIRT